MSAAEQDGCKEEGKCHGGVRQSVSRALSSAFEGLAKVAYDYPLPLIVWSFVISAGLAPGLLFAGRPYRWEDSYGSTSGRAREDLRSHRRVFHEYGSWFNVIVSSRGGANLLDTKVMRDLHELDTRIRSTRIRLPSSDESFRYSDVCHLRGDGVCDFMSVPRLFPSTAQFGPGRLDFPRVVYDSHGAVREVPDLSLFLSGVETREGKLVGASQMLWQYSLQAGEGMRETGKWAETEKDTPNRFFKVPTGPTEPRNATRAEVMAWMKTMEAELEREEFAGNKFFSLTVYSSRSVDDSLRAAESSLFSFRDLMLFGVVVILIALYASVVNFSKKTEEWRLLSALVGCLTPVLAFIGSSGLLYLCGLPHESPNLAVPFLVLGVGVDDVFVILSGVTRTWGDERTARRIQEGRDVGRPKERLAVAMRDSGISITLTTSTNLIGLLFGLMSNVFAIRNFCVFMILGLFFGYVMCLTFFLPFLAMDLKREANRERGYIRLLCRIGRMITHPLESQSARDLRKESGGAKEEEKEKGQKGDNRRGRMETAASLGTPAEQLGKNLEGGDAEESPLADSPRDSKAEERPQLPPPSSTLLDAEHLLFLHLVIEQICNPTRWRGWLVASPGSAVASADLQREQKEDSGKAGRLQMQTAQESQSGASPFPPTAEAREPAEEPEGRETKDDGAIEKPERQEDLCPLIRITTTAEETDAPAVTAKTDHQHHWQHHAGDGGTLFVRAEDAREQIFLGGGSVPKAIIRFVQNWWARLLLHPVVAALVALSWLAFLGLSVVSLASSSPLLGGGLKYGLHPVELTNRDAPLRGFFRQLEFLKDSGYRGVVFFDEGTEWWKESVQERLVEMVEDLEKQDFYRLGRAPLYEFLQETGRAGGRERPEEGRESGGAVGEEKERFEQSLAEWIGRHRYFKWDFAWEDPINKRGLRSWRFQMVERYCVTTDCYRARMVGTREFFDGFRDDFTARYFNEIFLVAELDLTILRSTLLSMGGVIGAATVMSSLLLKGLWAVVFVVVCVVAIDVSLFVVMVWWGLPLSILSAIILVLCAGFTVDYVVHVCHAFSAASSESRAGRVVEALVAMGPAVFHGALTVVVAGAPALFSKSAVFFLFFQMISAAIVIALTHGIVVLPVLLSLVGPRHGEKGAGRRRTEAARKLVESLREDGRQIVSTEGGDIQERGGVGQTLSLACREAPKCD
uniref:SSD domain-containing protein n=1 Tax=Chromera velia CCMP2878 TaxID=1169474 RepID=A0A0G4G6B9_9ALVE|eukprot:Cvel_4232.t1-p1 / transcript=Cvel_4232.t1 / gene=Cvel_4232 / organism=Chromera_velia_CCMP2878 / gene_product=Niemann-Pick C1 protein, putative / transcript_product=Niemann-Pick C1 protein, putative / location=Cvel_scaffold183:27245-35580(+) / protein_length=1197 / sequence_SO=supercontig / SO=protein_coding / is_pseudo=false